MKFVRIIALALITALANPFCCCLTGDIVPSNSSLEQKFDNTHACCAALQNQESDKNSEQAHTPEDCPHSYEKDSLISLSSNGIDSPVSPHLVEPAFSSSEDWTFHATQQEYFGNFHTFADSLPLLIETIAKAYCVFIL